MGLGAMIRAVKAWASSLDCKVQDYKAWREGVLGVVAWVAHHGTHDAHGARAVARTGELCHAIHDSGLAAGTGPPLQLQRLPESRTLCALQLSTTPLQ